MALIAIVLVWVLTCPSTATFGDSVPLPATSLTFQWQGNASVYSGSTPVVTDTANPVYLTAKFTNAAIANEVNLKLTANLGTPGGNREDVDDIYFNVTPDSLLNYLVASSTTAGVSFTEAADSTKAGPVHTFDLHIETLEGSNSVLYGTQSVSILLSLKNPPSGATLTAASFDEATTNTKIAPYQFYAAAHIQNTGTNGTGSSWASSGAPVPAPLPASAYGGIALLLSVLSGKALRRRFGN